MRTARESAFVIGKAESMKVQPRGQDRERNTDVDGRVLASCQIANALTEADYSRNVGIATGTLCPVSGLGFEEAPGAWGVCQD